MEKRRFGRTGLDLSVLTFGCGAVGGLMTKGAPTDQDRAVAWARDNGVNHFDTAPLYGDGASEENLGRALGDDRAGVVISTKVRPRETSGAALEAEIRASVETSLRRLRQDHVDLLQLHNTLAPTTVAAPGGAVMSPRDVLEQVCPILDALKTEGKTRFVGFTANGDTASLLALTRSGRFDAAQIFYNLLVPTAGEAVQPGYPGQDYEGLLHVARENGVGSIGVRVLAGGALSGSETRHPLGMAVVAPIGSGRDYAEDAERARAFQPLVGAGHADDLASLAIRYAVSNPALCTTEIGIATLEELQTAAAAANAGPLAREAMVEIDAIRAGFAQEER